MNLKSTYSPIAKAVARVNNSNDVILLTEAQTAEFMHLSPGTLRNARATGALDLPFIKLTPTKRGKIRYRQSDVIAWLEARTHRNTQETLLTGDVS